MINVELDLLLIKAFLQFDLFSKYYAGITRDSLSEEARLILDGLNKYYVETKVSTVELPVFVPWFLELHSHWKKEELEYYKHIFSRIMELKDDDIEVIVFDLKKQYLWRTLVKIQEKSFDTLQMEEMLHQFNSTITSNKAVQYLDYDTWVNVDPQQVGGFKWKLSNIQKAWGNIKPAQLYLVTATTHTGKSSFLSNEAANVCQQIGDTRTILYFNNERSESAVLERFLCSYYDRSVESIRKNRKLAVERFLKKHPHTPLRIISARDGKKTMNEIEMACSLYKPALVIIDVLDKLIIEGNNQSRRPYEYVFSWARNIAIKYNCIVMGATQYGVKTSKDGNIIEDSKMSQHGAFDAKVDKAANTDFMLGIQNVPNVKDQRKIYLLRAKEGDEDVNFYCHFNHETGVFSDARTI